MARQATTSGQIKSRERVRKHAEVFTAEREVKAMCDLVKEECERIDSRFLEPACGNGNFLVEIYERKLKLCKDEKDGLKALASMVGIDIQADSCEECRKRLMAQYLEAFPNANEVCILLAAGILQNNIICGDSLKIQEQWIKENENVENSKKLQE